MTTIIITVGVVAIVAVMLIIKFAGKTDEQSKPQAGNTGSDISGDKPADKGKPNLK